MAESDYNDQEEWVSVTHKDFKDAPNGRVTRRWLDGWGKDAGWTEVKDEAEKAPVKK